MLPPVFAPQTGAGISVRSQSVTMAVHQETLVAATGAVAPLVLPEATARQVLHGIFKHTFSI